MLSPTPPIRLCSILGYDGRVNDVVFCPPALRSDDFSTVVYFGGDVQDFPETMKLHVDNKNYIKWNLENMASMLNLTFPHSHIIIVRPSRIEFKTFSCYNNFVPSGNAGVPEHTPTHYALQHLERLLQNVSQRIKSMSKIELKDIISSSLNSQQFYMDVELFQVSISCFNSKLKQDEVLHIPKNNVQKELESTRNLTVTTTSHPVNATFEHNLPVTITKQNLESSKIDKLTQESVIQMTATNTAGLTVSTQCQSTPKPASYEETSNKNVADVSNSNSWWWYDDLALDKTKLTLIGFSKGCVVLNQLIYEFHYLKTLTPDDITTMNFVSRISDMFWLDGGHAGGKNTWITSRSLLETLTRLGIKIWIHVTPYQVQDNRRAWIRREEHAFTEILQKLGAQVTRTLHFDGATPDLHMHFDILNVFRSPQSYIGYSDK